MKIELIQSKFGLGEINSEIYMAIMSELNSRLAEIRRELEDAGKNLSNMMKYINQTIEMFCKLGLWSDTNLPQQHLFFCLQSSLISVRNDSQWNLQQW